MGKKNRSDVLRFGVRTADGRCSTVWRVWADRKKGDVYISARDLGGHFKASLHASGKCRAAFTAEHMARPRPLIPPDRDRAVMRWTLPAPLAPSVVQAFTIIVPSEDLGAPLGADDGLVQWTPAPPGGEVTFFTIALLAAGVRCSNWPGKNTGSELVGRIGLENGDTVWVVSNTRPETPEETTAWDRLRRLSRVAAYGVGATADDGHLRGVTMGCTPAAFFVDLLAAAKGQPLVEAQPSANPSGG